MEDQAKHYLISGLVQGVGFRRFVERTAQGLKLRGWVRNLFDGRVEAWAQGPKDTLAQLETQLRKGPSHSRVDSLVIKVQTVSAAIQEFTVRNDGEQPCADE